MRILLFCLMLIPSPLAALEYCDDLWFTRNLVFHRAGYCFGSTLGQTVFGNAGCTTSSPSLQTTNAALVARIISMEAEWGCRVNSAGRQLNVPDLEFRKSLVDLPVATEYESGCIGWRGAPFKLRSGRSLAAPQTARGQIGDNLIYQFQSVGDWDYIELFRNSAPAGSGWARIPQEQVICDNYAG